jgi:hypothetical protein
MASKAAPKKTKKEMEADKRSRLMKIILATVLVLIMIIVPLATLFNPSSLHNVGTDGTEKTVTFNSIADALMDLPTNANYVRYVNLTASSAVTNWTMLNLASNLPNATMFGRMPRTDVVASFPYPRFGLAYVEPSNQQVIVLSDFGPNFDNASYQLTTIGDAQLRLINSVYGFSIDSYPVVSGRKEYVAAVDSFMRSSTASNSAYPEYSALIAQANQSVSQVAFAAAGTSSTLDFGDRYYASVTPLDGTQCDYRIVIHLNQTINETRMQEIGDRWTAGASLYGIDANSPQFKGSYVVMVAKGDIDSCLNDMVTNWDFIRG